METAEVYFVRMMDRSHYEDSCAREGLGVTCYYIKRDCC